MSLNSLEVGLASYTIYRLFLRIYLHLRLLYSSVLACYSIGLI
jgi:hypothetical protein